MSLPCGNISLRYFLYGISRREIIDWVMSVGQSKNRQISRGKTIIIRSDRSLRSGRGAKRFSAFRHHCPMSFSWNEEVYGTIPAGCSWTELDGTKTFITMGPDADIAAVFAKADPSKGVKGPPLVSSGRNSRGHTIPRRSPVLPDEIGVIFPLTGSIRPFQACPGTGNPGGSIYVEYIEKRLAETDTPVYKVSVPATRGREEWRSIGGQRRGSRTYFHGLHLLENIKKEPPARDPNLMRDID